MGRFRPPAPEPTPLPLSRGSSHQFNRQAQEQQEAAGQGESDAVERGSCLVRLVAAALPVSTVLLSSSSSNAFSATTKAPSLFEWTNLTRLETCNAKSVVSRSKASSTPCRSPLTCITTGLMRLRRSTRILRHGRAAVLRVVAGLLRTTSMTTIINGIGS